MHELPLVIFTVLAQSAVGAYVLLLIAHKMSQINDRQLAMGLFVSMCLFGLGMIASMAHLGQVLRAFNVMFGMGRSPMSNEVLCAALFAGFGGLASLLLLLNRGPKGLWRMVAVVGGALGLAFVYVIPTVYNIATVSTWSSDYTVIYMLLTVFICGGAVAALLGAVRIGGAASIIATVVSLALKAGYFSAMWSANGELTIAQVPWLTAQLALLAIGLMLASLVSAKACECKMPLILCACVLIVAELCGRVVFYNLWTIPM